MKANFVAGAIVAAAVLGLATAAPAPAAPVHSRGVVTAVSSSTIDVTTSAGVVRLTTAGTKYVVVAPATRAAIRPNTFVGIATDGDAPGARAREVVVFPESMRGTGEGHYGWDLPHGGSSMTNGAVAPAPSSMTNGSVSARAGGAGPLVLNVTYRGGSRRIVVPASVPVAQSTPGDRGDVRVGTHVFVISGGGAARFVSAGKGATVPPM